MRPSGPNHFAWKGGIRKHSAGYLLQLCKGHPHADIHGYVYQHRLVMEKYLGRFLDYDETIHHINRNRSDNRIENLELIDRAEHTHRFPAFRNGTVKFNCLQCGKEVIRFKSQKVGNFCSQPCWYIYRKLH